jgi:hypothetical protein
LVAERWSGKGRERVPEHLEKHIEVRLVER